MSTTSNSTDTPAGQRPQTASKRTSSMPESSSYTRRLRKLEDVVPCLAAATIPQNPSSSSAATQPQQADDKSATSAGFFGADARSFLRRTKRYVDTRVPRKGDGNPVSSIPPSRPTSS